MITSAAGGCDTIISLSTLGALGELARKIAAMRSGFAQDISLHLLLSGEHGR
jgi:hypothetical protein